jgi:hypothetical protein
LYLEPKSNFTSWEVGREPRAQHGTKTNHLQHRSHFLRKVTKLPEHSSSNESMDEQFQGRQVPYF